MEERSPRPTVAALVVGGALAGAIATGLMSIVMLAAGRVGLMGTQPPEAIVERLMGWRSRLPWRELETNAAASAAHVAFGSLGGIGFALARRSIPFANRPGAGVAYALAIWASAYLGWVPALGILPRADRDRPGRPATMIAAHIVYGLVVDALTRRARAARPVAAAHFVTARSGDRLGAPAMAEHDGSRVSVASGELRTRRTVPHTGAR